MKLELRTLQGIELSILKIVSDYCDANNLNYYLIGGTMLGAARHKGFIPWDDDIDIAMNRKDYEFFIRNFELNHNEEFYLENKLNDPNIFHDFTKVRLKGTSFVEKQTKHYKSCLGISIDIFPLDKYKIKPNILDDFKYRIYKFLQLSLQYKSGYKPFPIFIKLPLNILSNFLSVKLATYICNFFMKEYNNSHEKGLTSYASGWGYKKHLMPFDVYDNPDKIIFEGLYFSCPKNYKFYLSKVYGDYKKLPQINKRNSHHFIDNIEITELMQKKWNYFEQSS